MSDIAREIRSYDKNDVGSKPYRRWADHVDRLEVERDRLREACKAFDVWFDGWCPTQCSCAISGKPIADQVRRALASCPVAEAERVVEG